MRRHTPQTIGACRRTSTSIAARSQRLTKHSSSCASVRLLQSRSIALLKCWMTSLNELVGIRVLVQECVASAVLVPAQWIFFHEFRITTKQMVAVAHEFFKDRSRNECSGLFRPVVDAKHSPTDALDKCVILCILN